MRLHISLIYPTIGLAAALFSTHAPISFTSILVPVLSIFMLSVSAYMLNDVFDLELDRISNPHRPLPSGILSVREVSAVACVSLLIGGSLMYVFGSFLSFLIALVLCGLLFAYSAPPLRLRRFFLAPYFTIASSASLSFLLASSFQSGVLTPRFVFGFILIFGYSTGSCMVKEFKDIEGDSRMGVQSLPVAFGLERAARVTIPIYLAACLLVLPFYWLFELHSLFLLFFGLVFLAKAKTSYDLLKDPSNMDRRMHILGVEVISTILLFLAAAVSAALEL